MVKIKTPFTIIENRRIPSVFLDYPNKIININAFNPIDETLYEIETDTETLNKIRNNPRYEVFNG